jgi:hypothetical protein
METDIDKELRQMQNEKKMFENEANLDKARFVLHLRETLGQEMLADLAEMEKEQNNFWYRTWKKIKRLIF